MRYTYARVLAVLVLAWAPNCASGQPSFTQGEILVKFTSSASEQAKASIHSRNGSRVLATTQAIGVQRVTAPKGREIEHCNRYKQDGLVEYAEPDYLAYIADTLPSDPFFASQQWDLTNIQAPAAWDITTGSESVIIAVVDTGVDYTHPDIASRVLPGYDFQAGDTDPMDQYGHGTMAAGVVGACSDNTVGVAGVTWNCMLQPLKTADASGMSTYSTISNAVIYAADSGARVATISLGGNSVSYTLQNAVNYATSKGCLIVAAAGNQYTNTVCYPAACDNAIAVGALDYYGNRYDYSNYGPALDISAPGYGYTTAKGGGYSTFGGTSAATPHVAGVAALLFSSDPLLTPAQVTDILTSSADDINTPGWDQYTGYGQVNAYEAMVTPSTIPADTTPPTVDNPYSFTQTFSGTSSKATKSYTFTTTQTASVSAALSWSGRATLQLTVYDSDGSVLALVSSAASPLGLDLGTYPAGSYRFEVRASTNKIKYSLTVSAVSN